MESRPSVLTVPEVADYLRVTTKTVYALIKRGELTSFRIGRALRCRRVDLQTFIRQHAQAASEDTQDGYANDTV